MENIKIPVKKRSFSIFNVLKKVVFYQLFGLLFLLTSCKKEVVPNVTNNPILIKIPASHVIKDPTSSKEVADSPGTVVVVLGSSTAVGMGASCADSSWVGRLRIKLTNDHKRYSLVNLGVGGFTTYQIMPAGTVVANRPPPDLKNNITTALSYNPRLVIINLPTNDIGFGFSDAEIINNYNTVVHLLDSAHVSYIITGTQPRNYPTNYQCQRLKNLNNYLYSVYGNHMCIYYDLLSDSNGWILPIYSFGDGAHLNDKGYKIIFNALINHPIYKQIFKP